jgi:hypothetical protein
VPFIGADPCRLRNIQSGPETADFGLNGGLEARALEAMPVGRIAVIRVGDHYESFGGIDGDDVAERGIRNCATYSREPNGARRRARRIFRIDAGERCHCQMTEGFTVAHYGEATERTGMEGKNNAFRTERRDASFDADLIGAACVVSHNVCDFSPMAETNAGLLEYISESANDSRETFTQ